MIYKQGVEDPKLSDLYRNKNIWNIRPVTLDGIGSDKVGTGNVTIGTNGAFTLSTGTTADSSGGLYLDRHIDYPFQFNLASRIFFQFCISAMAADGLWAKLFAGGSGAMIDTAHQYGFKFIREAGAIKCYALNADGTTAKTTDITGGMSFTIIGRRLEAVFTPGVDVKYYIDGVLKATHTQNLPTRTDPPFNWIIMVKNPGVASNCQIYLAQIVQIWDWW